MSSLPKKPFNKVEDIEIFFDAYNRRDWDVLFKYMSDDCIWDATEKRMIGRKDIIDYWTVCHGAISEKLGRPFNIVISDNVVYLEVLILMEFKKDGTYFGKEYNKGEYIEFLCADVYTLGDDGVIKEARIYVKFLNTEKQAYIKDKRYDILPDLRDLPSET